MKAYKVEFLIRKHGEHNYFVYVSANNQKVAKAVAKKLWEDGYNFSHMFHITAKQAEVDDDHYDFNTFYRVNEI